MGGAIDEQKQRVTRTFDLASDGYDRSLLRFFDLNARALVREAGIQNGERILDIATGTGKVALEAARLVRPRGRVVGIDISPGMLAHARRKTGTLPVDFIRMDAEALAFKGESFDAVLCGFGLPFLPDMMCGCREILRVLKVNGRFAFSWWTKQAFAPMIEIHQMGLRRYGIPAPPPAPEPWQELEEPAHYLTLLEIGGFGSGRVARVDTGYPLRDADDWWTIVWGSGIRGSLSRLAPEQLERFRAEMLDEVGRLRTDQGIWLDASALIGVGTKGRPT